VLHWLGVLGLVALGFAAEFASEVWGIHYTNSITGRYSRLSEAEITAKIWRARKWGALLFLLTQVDIGGASYGTKNRQRHVCFDHDCLEQILLRVQSRRLRYKIRRNKPLNFLVKDLDEQVIEMAEVNN
jgi:hypothetical protein